MNNKTKIGIAIGVTLLSAVGLYFFFKQKKKKKDKAKPKVDTYKLAMDEAIKEKAIADGVDESQIRAKLDGESKPTKEGKIDIGDSENYYEYMKTHEGKAHAEKHFPSLYAMFYNPVYGKLTLEGYPK
jgi:hypothetical protein